MADITNPGSLALALQVCFIHRSTFSADFGNLQEFDAKSVDLGQHVIDGEGDVGPRLLGRDILNCHCT
jgi:hypothetical protein